MSATVRVAIVGDATSAQQATGKAAKGLDSLQRKASAVAGGIGAAFAGVALVSGLKSMVNATIDLGETTSKVGVIFGKSAGKIEAFASTAATAFGQSKREALDAAATFATFGKSAGLTGDRLVTFSTKLTGLASDLASFHNTSPQEAIDALGAALRGEAEPMRRYGVLLDDASLRQGCPPRRLRR